MTKLLNAALGLTRTSQRYAPQKKAATRLQQQARVQPVEPAGPEEVTANTTGTQPSNFRKEP
jgi:hypothetical protein